MAIFRTRDPLEAARFCRELIARRFRRVPTGRRTMPAGTFRTRTYRRGWFGVVYGECDYCTTPGRERRKAEAHSLCGSCWARERYRNDPRVRERKKAASRRWYAKLTAEQKASRLRRKRVNTKLRRWAAAA